MQKIIELNAAETKAVVGGAKEVMKGGFFHELARGVEHIILVLAHPERQKALEAWSAWLTELVEKQPADEQTP